MLFIFLTPVCNNPWLPPNSLRVSISALASHSMSARAYLTTAAFNGTGIVRARRCLVIESATIATSLRVAKTFCLWRRATRICASRMA